MGIDLVDNRTKIIDREENNKSVNPQTTQHNKTNKILYGSFQINLRTGL